MDDKFLINSLKYELDQIAKILSEDKSQLSCGTLFGKAGTAIFQCYYANYNKDESYIDLAFFNLQKALSSVNNEREIPSFCGGIAGLGWAFSHLNQMEFIDIDENLLIDIDSYVEKALEIYIDVQNYDFLHGALGCSFYLLNRYQNSDNAHTKKSIEDSLRKFLISLRKSAIRSGDKIYWKSVIDESGKEGYNLGLAHGISGVINFLSRVYEVKIEKKLVIELIIGATRFLLSQEQDTSKFYSIFPSYIELDGKIIHNSRLGWCYGDLGIGFSLYRAGVALGQSKLKDKAISILKHTTTRKDINITSVLDAGFCHGSFGIAHIYNHIYDKTNDPVFNESAKYWLSDGLKKRQGQDIQDRFRKKTMNGWADDISVLEGLAGIGLVMISFLSDKNLNTWDECLMIS